VLDRAEGKLAAAEELERGGYVLWDSSSSPRAILISTGAEVAVTLEAARALAAEGTDVRVVSMPCMELFEAQPQAYRDAVLPPAVTARLAVEPGATMSWWKWVGTDGDVLGIDRFGASAPGARVLEELGFSVENIAARARALL
jgi:transketolase